MSNQSNNRPNKIEIDPNNVPEQFRALIPYAEKWGISDDGYLDNAIDEASLEDLESLVKAIAEFQVEGFDVWLSEPGRAGPTKEWIAFICLINANDLAKLRLQTEN